MGGVYNSQNLGLYSYAHLNPVKVTDPDGRAAAVAVIGGGVLIVGGVIYANDPQAKEAMGRAVEQGIDNFKSNMQWIGEKINNLVFNESQGGNDDSQGGAENASVEVTPEDIEGWIYGPENDPKINADGSTEPGRSGTWVSPDDYGTGAEATDKLDTYKPVGGRRPVVIPKGSEVKIGKTPGHQGPYNGSGGGNEINIPKGLPKGSVGKWEPLE
jgi:hypothetical protein